MDDNPHDNIIEGEVQEDSQSSSTFSEMEEKATSADASGQAIVLTNLESLIKSHIATLAKLQTEAREQKATLENVLGNDPTYKEHDEQAKAAAKIKAETRAQITKRPDVKHVAEKLKSLKSEYSEMQEELEEYLREYQRMSGATEIEGENGEMFRIETKAKLVRSSTGR